MELTQQIPMLIRKDWFLNLLIVIGLATLIISAVYSSNTQNTVQSEPASPQLPLIDEVKVSEAPKTKKLNTIRVKRTDTQRTKIAANSAAIAVPKDNSNLKTSEDKADGSIAKAEITKSERQGIVSRTVTGILGSIKIN